MIVKNESAVIQRCLDSVKSVIDYWVIVDTGSTDGTQQIIQESLKEIPGLLFERPWVDFAANRNAALELAKNKGDYLLFIDADDQLVFRRPGFTADSLDKDFYVVAYHHNGLIFQRTLLICQKLDWKWMGTVHETVECKTAKDGQFLSDVYLLAHRDGRRSQKRVKKFSRDAEILQTMVDRDPNDAHSVFHLAGSYHACGENERALQCFTKRSQMGGCDLERFISIYRTGIIQRDLKMAPEIFIASFVKAHLLRPTRVEPLYHLAAYYMSVKCYLTGYLIAKMACTIPKNHDYFFDETAVEEFGMLYQFAECAFHIGRLEESHRAFAELLAKENIPPALAAVCKKHIDFTMTLYPNGILNIGKWGKLI